MKKVISLLMIYAALAFLNPVPVQAQFQASPTTVISRGAVANLVATCTTTACPTYILGGSTCTATVQVGGTNTAAVITVKISYDGGNSYNTITPVVVGLSTNGTVTSSVIQVKGVYSMTLLMANRVRFEVGTLTGTNVTIAPIFSSACTSQAL